MAERKDGKRVDWVIGNVVFTQNQTTIYCDSAQIFKAENSVEAFGHVKITDGDSVTVTSQTLRYDGDKRISLPEEECGVCETGDRYALH